MAHDAPPSPELDDRTIETAIALDIDPFAEDHLLWIARSAQNDAELPPVGIDARSRTSPRATQTPRSAWSDPITRGPREFRVLVAQERRRTAARAHRPHPEQPRKRARTGNASGGGGGDECDVADGQDAPRGRPHRRDGGVAQDRPLKGAQRKVAELERRLIEREEAWENERMEAEARTHRVVVEAEGVRK